MSVSIFIREPDMPAYVADDGKGGVVLSMTLADGLRFPNLVAAKEAFTGFAEKFRGMNMDLVAADPERSSDPRDIEPMGELDDLVEVPTVPLRGAVVLYAELRKSSKYYHQFAGAQPVTHIIPPSWGDAYCFRVAHNAYRHEDLSFSVKVNGELMPLGKFPVAKRKAVAA